MRELVIHNWGELQEAIFEGVWDERILRCRNNRVFRGVADKRWGLVPSLNRTLKNNLFLEKQVLRSFQKYGYADLTSCRSFWQLLAMGQQFGLPTRLLDWTYSPLVAAHFATEDTESYNLDGAILSADMDKLNALLPLRIREQLVKERSTVFSMEMLDKLAHNLDELKALSPEPFALFFEPASAVNRIANQYALFSLSSDPTLFIDSLPHADDAFTRIVIPGETKLEIRDKLDYINVSERMIYPGLDGICRWISRHYSPLGPENAALQKGKSLQNKENEEL